MSEINNNFRKRMKQLGRVKEHKIKIEDKFHIKGRGTVYTFKVPTWLAEFSESTKCIGEVFLFEFQDKEFYGLCKGIEQFAKDLGKPLKEDDRCAFLIKELEELNQEINIRGYVYEADSSQCQIIKYAVKANIDLTNNIITLVNFKSEKEKVYVVSCESDDTTHRLIKIKSLFQPNNKLVTNKIDIPAQTIKLL